MNIIDCYKNYRAHLPEYPSWSKEKDENYLKRLEFAKNNPSKTNFEDIQRGKILLHAIDVIDEYSQSNAEDTEVASEAIMGQILMLATFLGMLGGMALLKNKSIQKRLSKIARNNEYLQFGVQMLPSIAGVLFTTIASFPAVIMSTKFKVSASRRGRFEAMNKDLSNPAMFAVLTEEQKKKVEEIAETLELEEKDKKRLKKTKSMGANPLDSFKTIQKLFTGNKEYKIQKTEFDNKLKKSSIRIGTVVSNQQIKEAQRDRQILSDIVRKIDIASQDYAENTELATNAINTLAFGTGGLIGWISNKLLKHTNLTQNQYAAKTIPWFVGLALPLGISIYAAKIQKQASRIGRYKVKQEMLNNPSSMVYVNQNDIDSIKNIDEKNYYKKPNLIDFSKNLLKDYKEYNNYVKNSAEKELKRLKSTEKINISPEQLKDAKQLQLNVFKTFNKVDEKSQEYSENIEAIGAITQRVMSFVLNIAATCFSIKNIIKMLNNPAVEKTIENVVWATLKPILVATLPLIGIDIITTKMQKKASRVADMLALKELSDYRNYIDYSQFDSKFLQNKPLTDK